MSRLGWEVIGAGDVLLLGGLGHSIVLEADPTTHQVGIDLVGQRNGRGRYPRLQARCNDLGLEYGGVATATTPHLGKVQGIHVSTKKLGGHDAPMNLKTAQCGQAGRLHCGMAAP